MKINTRYGSMWDELKVRYEPKVPDTQEEAEELAEAAKASAHDALMKTIDAHNESVRRAAEQRKKTQQKQAIEKKAIEQREEQHRIFEEEAIKRKRNAEIFA